MNLMTDETGDLSMFGGGLILVMLAGPSYFLVAHAPHAPGENPLIGWWFFCFPFLVIGVIMMVAQLVCMIHDYFAVRKPMKDGTKDFTSMGLGAPIEVIVWCMNKGEVEDRLYDVSKQKLLSMIYELRDLIGYDATSYSISYDSIGSLVHVVKKYLDEARALPPPKWLINSKGCPKLNNQEDG